jgi:hypothetical protein
MKESVLLMVLFMCGHRMAEWKGISFVDTTVLAASDSHRIN